MVYRLRRNFKIKAFWGDDYNPLKYIKFPRNFICTICNNTLKNAIIIEKCKHVVCNECIRNKMCPICNDKISKIISIKNINKSLNYAIENSK
jgi:hypothetical protein